MFFRRRHGFGLFKLILLLLGFKAIKCRQMSEEERREYQAKARKFRSKMREAYAVWSEDEDDSDTLNDTETQN